jgi:hypothetical protein
VYSGRLNINVSQIPAASIFKEKDYKVLHPRRQLSSKLNKFTQNILRITYQKNKINHLKVPEFLYTKPVHL